MAAFNQERFTLATDDTIAELRKIPTPAKVYRCVEDMVGMNEYSFGYRGWT